MKTSLTICLVAGALVSVALPATSPAMAQAVACGAYQPGLLAFMLRTRPAPCSYQGDYMVQQGPTYDGPAVIAPQPTYSPSRTVVGYMPGPHAGYMHGPYQAEPATHVRRTVVNNDLPPRKGKVQIVKAQAEVRIYGPERMEIKLYRR
jgi:hypothetical protein